MHRVCGTRTSIVRLGRGRLRSTPTVVSTTVCRIQVPISMFVMNAIFLRVAAAFTLIVLFLLTIVVTVLGIQSIGIQIIHGSEVQHQHGVILSLSDTDKSLILKTDSGQRIYFACTQRCLNELGHIQRHIYEQASTDVYYKQKNNT